MSNKEKVCFPSENKQGACPGVLTGDTSKSSMGLVVLQEWWGMNQVIIDEAADISERGNFVTLVPDLYRGKVATDRETAGHYAADLDWPGAVQDIAGAAKYLKEKGGSILGTLQSGLFSLQLIFEKTQSRGIQLEILNGKHCIYNWIRRSMRYEINWIRST